MTDYIACGKVVPERIAAIVAGIAEGCASPAAPWSAARPPSTRGCSAPDEYDVAGAGDRRRRGGPSCSAPTGSAPATSWSRWRRRGLHSNGYSLVRHVLLDAGRAGRSTAHVAELGRTLGEELLEPTRIYALDCLALRRARRDVHALSHVTGGGLAANLARVLPARAARLRSTGRPGRRRRSSAWSAAGRGAAGRARAHAQHGRRHGRAAGPGRRRRRCRLLAERGVPAGSAGEVRTPGARRARRRWWRRAAAAGAVSLLGTYARTLRRRRVGSARPVA